MPHSIIRKVPIIFLSVASQEKFVDLFFPNAALLQASVNTNILLNIIYVYISESHSETTTVIKYKLQILMSPKVSQTCSAAYTLQWSAVTFHFLILRIGGHFSKLTLKIKLKFSFYSQ